MATAATRGTSALTASVMSRVTAAAAGGVAGGLVFGMMMQAMGMIPMVAQLVGSSSTAVGWVVHLAISAVIGGLFGVITTRFSGGTLTMVGAGAGYGMVWWVLGPLLLMPAKLGMPLFTIDSMAWKSLMGHIIFGMVLGAVSWALGRRATA